jgi:hypothetical protein
VVGDLSGKSSWAFDPGHRRRTIAQEALKLASRRWKAAKVAGASSSRGEPKAPLVLWVEGEQDAPPTFSGRGGCEELLDAWPEEITESQIARYRCGQIKNS